ncbi:MAG: hypothetical protein A2Y33_00185 [Spirochaetes bacterium GWF1_51_8]|nr:MAG: hypothetical protein A2Y33_00185 [Spirochaetes bacterium GWF1_51_8]
MKFSIVLLVSFILAACSGAAVKPAKEQGYAVGGTVILKSQYLKPAPALTVYLPPDYKQSTNSYPVLYMFDGQNLDKWKLVPALNSLTEKGLLPGIIVVGIDHRGAKRIFDMTPTEGGEHGGGLPDYARFIVEEVKPYIDSHYRTQPDPKHTGVMGSSLGGLSSFYMLGWYPEIFGKAGVISPSFWWDDRQALKDAATVLKFSPGVKIYFDAGWREGGEEAYMIADIRDIYLKMKSLGFKDGANLHYYEDVNGSHNEDTWAKRLPMALLFLFSDYKPVYTNTSLALFPPKVGVGDVSHLIAAQTDTKGLMKKTIYPAVFTADPANKVSIDGKGGLKGLIAGTVKIALKDYGVSLPLDILAESRELVTVTVKVLSPVAVKSMKLEWVAMNEKKTNGSFALQLSADGKSGTAVLKKLKGLRLEASVSADGGMKGYSPKGEAVIKKIIFTADKETEITIGEWK